MSKLFATLSIVFQRPTKLFSDLYLAKFLDTSAKSFFTCTHACFIFSLPRALRLNF